MKTRDTNLEAGLRKCITRAIHEFGIERFKQTSMFLSNEMKRNSK